MILMCIALLSISLVEGRGILTFPEEFVPEIIKASADCTDKLGLETIDILPKFFSGELKDSDLIRKYVYCLGTNTGYADENGNMVKDKIAKVVGEHKEKVECVVDECNKVKYNDKYETLFRAARCLREKSGLEIKL